MQWHWELLTIPLIALGVWILGTLFKGGGDDRSKKNARGSGGFGGRASPRRPVTDLNRYLEEARLRREAEEKLQAPPPITTRPTLARPPLRERQATPREAPPVRMREVPTAIPVASPVTRPTRAEPVLMAAPAPAEATPRSPIAPPGAQETPSSPLLQQVRSLLSKPQSAGAAFALREIFAPPLCRRRR